MRTQVVDLLYQGRDPFAGFPIADYQEDLQGWGGNHPIFERTIDLYNPKLVIEVGSWKGQSSITIGHALKRREAPATLICVDTWLGAEEHFRLAELPMKNGYPTLYYQFAANVILNELADIIVPIPQTSHIAAEILQNNKLRADLIYIDASHEYADVLEDLQRYGKLLSDKGCIIGDDFADFWPGVVKAALEYSASVGLNLYVFDTKFFITRDPTRIPDGCVKFARQAVSTDRKPDTEVIIQSSNFGISLGPEAEASVRRPREAAIVVFITFHFRQGRLQYLFEVLRCLGEFPVRLLTVVVVTNTVAGNELAKIRRLGQHTMIGAKELQVLSCPGLSDGVDLTWSHKSSMKQAFEKEDEKYSHFIYLEEDIRFSYANFCYFVQYSAPLALHGLIPGFLRIEYNFAQDDLYSTDIVISTSIENRSSLILDNFRFINTEYPYMGMFVMNRRHLAEYLASVSFDKVRSVEVSSWGNAERAAMGLTWEAIPAGFTARSVLPIDLSTRLPSPSCYVHHLPNNYTNDGIAEVPFGKMRISELFF